MYKTALVFLSLLFTFSASAAPSKKHSVSPQKKKTICLNMIVKDESEVIETCLGSLKHLIDYWVIFDTGSSDGTQKVVKNFMKGVPGELHERPWVNFAHNRNEALEAARGKADYILLIDADEYLEFSENFSLPGLDKDVYYMTIRQLQAADCKRIGMIKSDLDWKWVGVLHEVLESSQVQTAAHLEGVINICNASEGARARDPERGLKDALVLEKALEEDPTNSRYVYYLGVSYLASDVYDKALEAFEKRAVMESEDIQETYMALYHAGICQEKLGRYDEAVKSFFKAYQFRPTRAEPLFRVATIYRIQQNYLMGYLLSKYALTMPCPKTDSCIEYMTYDYALLIEFANCALLLGKYDEGLQASLQLLFNKNIPQEIRDQIISNCEFARQQICANDPSQSEEIALFDSSDSLEQ